MRLELEGVGVTLDGRLVLKDLSFVLPDGCIGCLLGPSGSGKTTALRAIAGFQELTHGQIVLDGNVIGAVGYSLPPEKRRIGMVFQDYALLPHLTVFANVRFGLHELSRQAGRERTNDVLTAVGLADVAGRYPHELSGGQQQRVALARAVAPNPRLLLLDEPFSNLDGELRERLRVEVRDYLKASGITALLVTHDQYEAFAFAEEIGILREGRLEQWETPYDLYHKPATRFVADFVGRGVLLPGTVVAADNVLTELGELKGIMTQHYAPGTVVEVLIRPDDVVYDEGSELTARVQRRAFRGADILYTLRLPSGARLLSLVPSHHDHCEGETVGIRLETDHLVVFPRAGS